MRAIKKILKAALLIDLLIAIAAVVAKYTIKSEGEPGDDVFRVVAIFDGAELRSTAGALQRGQAIAMFGGVQLDLRRATPASADSSIDATAVFGGVEIIVPDTWVVTVGGPAFAGGINTKVTDHRELAADAPALTVSARAVFGGVNVIARPILKAAEG